MSENVDHLGENVTSQILSGDLNIEKIILPKNYDYLVTQYKEANDLKLEFLTNIETKEDAVKWVESFEFLNKVSLKIQHSNYKKYITMQYNCHHSTKGKKSKKNTGCMFKVYICIFNCKNILYLNKNKYTCKMKLMHSHNHPLTSTAVLNYRKVSSATKEKLKMLYRHGHSIKSSQNYLELEIENDLQDGEVLSDKLADRSILPDYFYRRYIYKKVMDVKNGHKNDIQYYVELYNKEFDEPCVKIDGDLIAICSPTMQRVHKHLFNSSNVVFIDSSRKRSNHDELRIFIFFTYSYAGGMPLAIGITNSESSESLIQLFQLIKSMLPEHAFGGRGEMGPLNFITEGGDAEQIALKTIWPDSELHLGQVHVLKAVWCWLLNETHGIHIYDRQFCISFFRSLMYSPSESRLHEIYNAAISEDIIPKYPQFTNYIIKLLERKDEWVHYPRIGKIFKSDNINNNVEVAMSSFMDEIFYRTNLYNMIQLVHHLTFVVDSFYMQKALDAAHTRYRSIKHFNKEDLSDFNIKKLENNTYSVSSKRNADVLYTVDIALKTCSCISGSTAKQYCKHVAFCLDSNFNDYASNSSLSDRNNLYMIGTGTNAPLEWLIPLHQAKIIEILPDLPVHFNMDNEVKSIYDASIENPYRLQASENSIVDNELKYKYITLFINKINSLFERNPEASRTAMLNFGKSLENMSESNLLSFLQHFGTSFKQEEDELIPVEVISLAFPKKEF